MNVKVQVELRNWDEKKLIAAVGDKLQVGLDKAATFIQGKIVASFGNAPLQPDSRGGFKENSSRTWKETHTSAEGGPPNVVTGALKQSITWDRNGGEFNRRVGSSLQPTGSKHSYAYYLEYGTSRMRARPYLWPPLYIYAKEILNFIARGVHG